LWVFTPNTSCCFAGVVVESPKYSDQIFTRFQANQSVPKPRLSCKNVEDAVSRLSLGGALFGLSLRVYWRPRGAFLKQGASIDLRRSVTARSVSGHKRGLSHAPASFGVSDLARESELAVRLGATAAPQSPTQCEANKGCYFAWPMTRGQLLILFTRQAVFQTLAPR